MNTQTTEQTTQAGEHARPVITLWGQAYALVERLRLDHVRDEQVLPAFGLSEK